MKVLLVNGSPNASRVSGLEGSRHGARGRGMTVGDIKGKPALEDGRKLGAAIA